MNKRRNIEEIIKHIDFRSLRSIIDSLVIERMKDGMSLEEIYEMYRMGELADFPRCMCSREIGVAGSILDKRSIDGIIKQYGVSATEILRIIKRHNIHIKDYEVENLSVLRDIIEALDFFTNADPKYVSNALNIDEDTIWKVLGYKSYNKSKKPSTPVDNKPVIEDITEEYNVSQDDVVGAKPVRRMSNLSFNTLQSIVKDINSGISVDNVATKYNVSPQLVNNVVNRRTSIINGEKIFNLYKQGYTCYDIGVKFDIPHTQVYELLKWYNVPIHNKSISDELGNEVMDRFNSFKDKFTSKTDMTRALSNICEEFNLDRHKLASYIGGNGYNTRKRKPVQ